MSPKIKPIEKSGDEIVHHIFRRLDSDDILDHMDDAVFRIAQKTMGIIAADCRCDCRREIYSENASSSLDGGK